jgi:hypothetical protein
MIYRYNVKNVETEQGGYSWISNGAIDSRMTPCIIPNAKFILAFQRIFLMMHPLFARSLLVVVDDVVSYSRLVTTAAIRAVDAGVSVAATRVSLTLALATTTISIVAISTTTVRRTAVTAASVRPKIAIGTTVLDIFFIIIPGIFVDVKVVAVVPHRRFVFHAQFTAKTTLGLGIVGRGHNIFVIDGWRSGQDGSVDDRKQGNDDGEELHDDCSYDLGIEIVNTKIQVDFRSKHQTKKDVWCVSDRQKASWARS